MPGNLRTIRTRIKSVISTQKITRAMKMVAAARLRKAQERVVQAGPYVSKVNDVLKRLSSSVSEDIHPLLKQPEGKKRILIVLSSDRGLCGAFNANVLRRVREDLAQSEYETELVLIGRKAQGYFSNRKVTIESKPEEFWTGFNHEKAKYFLEKYKEKFLSGEVDRVEVVYNEFISVMTQKVEMKTLLPFVKPEAEDSTPQKDYLFEPSKEEIVQTLIPRVLDMKFYVACLHSQASEFGARMTSMDSATRNAGDMISNLTLTMNRARQAAITNELVEIISGAEALQ